MMLYGDPITPPSKSKEIKDEIDTSKQKIRIKLPEEKSKEQVIDEIKQAKEKGLIGFALEGLVQNEQKKVREPVKEQLRETVVEINQNIVEKQLPWIAGYKIEKELGRGSVGTVYLAKDNYGNFKAIKVLHDKEKMPADLEKTIEKISAKIDDKRIVKIKEHKLKEDFEYLVMDYVDGKSLDSKEERDELAKVKVMKGLAERIAYLHSRAIAHFDIKPGNVLIGKDGEVYLADVELAQIIQQKDRLDESLRTTMLKGDSKHLLGTIKYMAPELLDEKTRKTADLQADIYSLGVVMYELLTNGEFPGSEAREELKERKVPDKLIDMTLKALKKDKTKRYQKIDELVKELDEFYKAEVYKKSPEFEKKEKAKIKYLINALTEKGTREEQEQLFNEAIGIKEKNLEAKVDSKESSYWSIAKKVGESILSPFMLPTHYGRRIIEYQTGPYLTIAAFSQVSMLSGVIEISSANDDFIFPLICLAANVASGVYELARSKLFGREKPQQEQKPEEPKQITAQEKTPLIEAPKTSAEYFGVAQVLPQPYIFTGIPLRDIEEHDKQTLFEISGQKEIEGMYAIENKNNIVGKYSLNTNDKNYFSHKLNDY